MREIKNVGVLGAGSIGSLIGALAAEGGFNVKIRDIEQKYLELGRQIIEETYDKRVKKGGMPEEKKREIIGRLTFVTDLKEAMKDADFVIEAVPDLLDLKRKVFKEASELVSRQVIN